MTLFFYLVRDIISEVISVESRSEYPSLSLLGKKYVVLFEIVEAFDPWPN
jgi:hypothetical protein